MSTKLLDAIAKREAKLISSKKAPKASKANKAEPKAEDAAPGG